MTMQQLRDEMEEERKELGGQILELRAALIELIGRVKALEGTPIVYGDAILLSNALKRANAVLEGQPW